MAFDTNRYTESPFLKGDDIEDGERLVVTIKTAEEVTFPQSGDTAPVLSFLEVEKKLTLNKTRVKKLVDLLGEDTDEWVGKKVALYSVDVNFQGKITRGVAVAAAPKKRSGVATQEPEVAFERGPAKKQAQIDDEDNPF